MVVAIGAGMCIVGIGNNLQERKLTESVKVIENQLQFAQALAKTTHSEVQLVFSKKETGWSMALAPDFKAAPHLRAHVGMPKKLEGISDIRSTNRLPGTNERVSVSLFASEHDTIEQELEILCRDGSTKKILLKPKERSDVQKNVQYPEEVLKKEQERIYAD